MGRNWFGQVGRLRRDKIEDYRALHQAPWPEVLETIRACNLRDYRIYLQDDLVFACFAYTGDDYEKDLARMAADEATRRWWTHTHPCFERFAFSDRDEFYRDMDCIFQLDSTDPRGEETEMDYGKRVWVFPDAELPPRGVDAIPGHESVIITNLGEREARVRVTLLYTDREPVAAPEVRVGARRVRCLRTDEAGDFGGCTASIGEQYAILLESDVPVVAQYGRAEPRAVHFYTTPGYCE